MSIFAILSRHFLCLEVASTNAERLWLSNLKLISRVNFFFCFYLSLGTAQMWWRLKATVENILRRVPAKEYRTARDKVTERRKKKEYA